MKKIIIDTLGADNGAELIINGVLSALKNGIDFFPVLVGPKQLIDDCFTSAGYNQDNYEVVDTSEFISASDIPTCIFGGRDNTSMALALDRLKADSECIALASAGNTGVLLVGSICRVGLLPSLKFPALCSALPCASDENLLCLVDCGANIECTASDLVRYAKMGNVFSSCYCQIPSPRIGLMSVGREKQKGTAVTKEAFGLLSELDLNFIGNLEGSDIVSGYADVIVCDGYAGNLLLKATEAAGKAAMEVVSRVADEELANKINAQLFKKFDFNSQGAATFLGVKKIIVKMHGAAEENTVEASIRQILRLDDADFSAKMAQAMTEAIKNKDKH